MTNHSRARFTFEVVFSYSHMRPRKAQERKHPAASIPEAMSFSLDISNSGNAVWCLLFRDSRLPSVLQTLSISIGRGRKAVN